ncbi:uncharacterized protein LOC123989004 [Osmia bicornis bicornis]|uniref:uncharacterized protein LOC123989004 n=1 Tax=Osmia bicornis bicornis TaxID=1437191 RepID=UPI001EAED771|nr:uncharacterized protein LOC123989004 [Osmia bicornis bicornis]
MASTTQPAPRHNGTRAVSYTPAQSAQGAKRKGTRMNSISTDLLPAIEEALKDGPNLAGEGNRAAGEANAPNAAEGERKILVNQDRLDPAMSRPINREASVRGEEIQREMMRHMTTAAHPSPSSLRIRYQHRWDFVRQHRSRQQRSRPSHSSIPPQESVPPLPSMRMNAQPPITQGPPKTAMSAFTVLQINLNHCRAAQDILWQAVHDYNVDIAVISEPYLPRPEWHTDPSGFLSVWYVERAPRTTELGIVRKDTPQTVALA